MKYLKKHRLLAKIDMQPVFDCGKKTSNKYLLALYHPNTLSYPRIAILVSKKHLSRAVDRNRVRRIVREGFRAAITDLQPIDIIVIIRARPNVLDRQVLRSDIDSLFLSLTRTGLLSP